MSHKNSKCLDFASVQVKHIVQKRAFFSHTKQNVNMSHLTQWYTKDFLNIKLVSHGSKPVSCENSKCLDFATVRVKHSSKQVIFCLMPNGIKKWVMFDTVAYKGLLKYQINFPLFTVSELWKFQMSAFFIGIGETVKKNAIVINWNSLKTRNFLKGEFWVLSYHFLP